MSIFKNLPPAPAAPKKPVTDTRHGITRTDDYAWLRADNWQAMFKDPTILDPEIRKHLEAENAYMKAAMADTDALQKTLFAEMKGRIKEDDSSVPVKDGPFAYGTFYVTGGEQPSFFRTPRDGGERSVLLDGDKEAEGKAYFRLGGVDHFDRSQPWPVELRRQGLGILHPARPRSGDRRGPGRCHREHRRRWRLGAGRQELLLHRARRQPPSVKDFPPHHRHAAERRPAGLRGGGSGLLHGRRRLDARRFHLHRHPRPRDQRILAAENLGPHRQTAAGGCARNRP